MVGSFVMTEHELLKKRPTPDSVGMGSYGIDSHNIQRYITPEGYVQNEGDIGVSTKGPYQIAYGSLVPRADRRVRIESVDFDTTTEMSLDCEIAYNGSLDLVKAAARWMKGAPVG